MPNLLHSEHLTDQDMFYSYQREDFMKSEFRPFPNSKMNVTSSSSLTSEWEKYGPFPSFMYLRQRQQDICISYNNLL